MLSRPAPASAPLAPVTDLAGAPFVARALSEAPLPLLERAITAACDELLRRQSPQGCWQFELEADCTIPAEYIMMMHFLGETDRQLEAKIAVYLRARQADHGGWPLYHDGAFDISCSVKAYFALKLVGDSPELPHMVRARAAILQHGGAAATNVFTRIALALFGQLPWRAVPYMPVEIVLLPRWFPFNIHKVSYWSRTVMVPLLILCTLKPLASNRRNVQLRELFTTPPEEERHYFRRPGARTAALARIFLAIDRLARSVDGLIPRALRARALRRAEAWMLERLNGEDGLGAIFPAMVNALEALAVLGYPSDHPRRRTAKSALEQLLVVDSSSAYCQPCVSPVWDTALARSGDAGGGRPERTRRGDARTRMAASRGRCSRARETGAYSARRSRAEAGRSSAPTATTLTSTTRPWSPGPCIARALPSATRTPWTGRSIGLSGCRAATAALPRSMWTTPATTSMRFRSRITARCSILRRAMSPPVSSRLLSLVGRPRDAAALARAIAYLRREQESDGSWFGRWGTNYLYGTWSVLVALAQAGIGPR